MKRLFLATVMLAIAAPSFAQELARVYQMTPKTGHQAEFEAAMDEHAKWREANGDDWTWAIFEIINGPELGQFVARSGGHSWSDFDDYSLEGAGANFNSTVGPWIENTTSVITRSDTTNFNWPDWEEGFEMLSIVYYEFNTGMVDEFQEAIGRYHSVITESDQPIYYAFDFTVNGGTGSTATVAFPARNWADMGPNDPTLGSLMREEYSDIGFDAIVADLQAAVKSSRSAIVALRRDLSVNMGN